MSKDMRKPVTAEERSEVLKAYEAGDSGEDMDKALQDLRADDAVALLSMMRDQIVWVFGFVDMGDGVRILVSQRLRIEGGHWSPYMLANYAEKAGLELVNRKRFEEHFKHLVDEEMAPKSSLIVPAATGLKLVTGGER